MNRIAPLLLIFVCFSLIFISCEKENTVDYSQWKASNEAIFNSYKDSVGYSLITVSSKDGGGQYYSKIVVTGNPSSITATDSDIVLVNYKLSLVTKSIIDYTYVGNDPRNDINATPIEFTPYYTIIGFKSAIKQMKEGEIRSIVLPSSLGYGEYGVSSISPFSTLLFDIQLIKIKPKVK